MKHPPYESWILSGQPLNFHEQAEMDSHLAQCHACRTLRDGVMRAEAALRGAPLAEPRAGFGARWRSRLDAGIERRRSREAWWAFAWTNLAAVPVALALGWQALAFSGSLSGLLANALQQAIRWWTWLRLTGEIGRTLVVNLPLPALSGALLGWMALLAAAGSLALAWSALMIRYSPQGEHE